MPLKFASIIVFCLGICVPIETLRADIVRTLSGGEIRGELQSQSDNSTPSPTVSKPSSPILNSPLGSKQTVVKTQSGALISISRDQIDFLFQRPLLHEQYITKSRTCEPTVAAHLELASWCKDNQLADQRLEELNFILQIDPNHAETRRELGFVLHKGVWLTQDEWMHERGYLRYRGKWITRQELQITEQQVQAKNLDTHWRTNLSKWTNWLEGNREDLKQLAIQELGKVTDPDAIPALSFFLGRHAVPEIRLVHVQCLSQLTGQKAIPALVTVYLTDDSELVSRAALSVVFGKSREIVLPYLLTELKSPNNRIVCRSAIALGELGDRRAVTPLIHALITSHGIYQHVPLDVSFEPERVDADSLTSRSQTQRDRLSQHGLQDNSEQPVGFPTFVPPFAMSAEVKNQPVLEALMKLTGKNFGYHQRDWHQWWAIQQS